MTERIILELKSKVIIHKKNKENLENNKLLEDNKNLDSIFD